MKPKDRRTKPTIATIPNGVIFSRNLLSRGFYSGLLQDLMRDPSKCISIAKDDHSAHTQIVNNARKLNIRLLKATQDNFIYFKIFAMTEPQKSILEALVQSKTINELRALKLECNLEYELKYLSGQGFCKLSPQSKWYITDEGREELKRP